MADSFADDKVIISEAWINEAPPAVSVLAGYMTIRNTSMENIEIIKVESAVFSRVEIHKSLMENGIAKMQKQGSLTIPANTEIYLEPGGYHLMLFNNGTPLKSGQLVIIDLILSNGEKLIANAEIKRLDLQHQHNHH